MNEHEGSQAHQAVLAPTSRLESRSFATLTWSSLVLAGLQALPELRPPATKHAVAAPKD